MSEVADRGERARALDPLRSFIVQAPAGSGKTELLIQRFLALLARVERPEEVVAITFTRKAAAEMRRRILEALSAARHGPRPTAAHAAATWDLARAALGRDDALGWEVERNAARLRVQTIDALCASLTRQLPVVACFGSQPESVEDASLLHAEAARHTLAALEDRDDPAAADVERLLAHLDNDVPAAETLLADTLRRRDHWIRSLTRAPGRDGLEDALDALRRAAVRRARSIFPAVPGMPPLPAEADVEGWRGLAESLLTKEGTWRKRSSLARELEGEEGLRAALDGLRSLPPARYDDAQWEALGAITRLMPRAVAELKLVFAARGQADFVEIAQGALRALQGEHGPTDLMLALDYRIRHLLVDEFQDTSYTQLELLRLLTGGWQSGDGRTLFVVGDPMQSIYRFREAEVALFLQAQREGIGGVALEPLTLSANFRSRGGIVDWVNATFPHVMPAAADPATGAVGYSPSTAVHPAEGAAVEVHPFFEGDAAGEGAKVAQVAAQALQAGADATVAILVRTRAHLRAIVPALREAGIAFRAIEIEPLGHRPMVQDLLALTRALGHPADRTAWLGVLRAPWCGLRLADLEVVASFRAPRTVWESMHDADVLHRLSAEGCERLVYARDTLSAFVARRGRGPLREVVEGAWLALGGPARAASDTDLADADAFLAHLEKSEEAGVLADPAAFESRVAALFALPDLAADARLQLMTIHKAKGLEFDTVIVPGLGAGTARDDRKLFLWMETPAGLVLAPVNPTGSDRDPAYEFIRALDRERADHECGRLLYVAATRAKRSLHLLGCCGLDEGVPRPPPKGSLLAKLWPVVASRFAQAAVGAPAAGELAAPVPPRQDLVRFAAPVRFEAPGDVAWQRPHDKERREAIEFSWAGLAARHVGTVVHRWLQRMADDGLRGWDAARVQALRPALAAELLARGVSRAELEAAVSRAAAALTACLADARGSWLLGPQPGARNEYRLSAVVDGERRQYVIDRMFDGTDGRRWIVDYKTSTHEGGDLERFLAEEERRYAVQLERYAAIAASGRARLGLYFPLLRAWREWEFPGEVELTGE